MTYEEILRRIVRNESSGNPLAQAKTTTAGGLYGFTDGTLASVLKRMNPDLYGGKSAKELGPLKYDPEISSQAAKFHLQNDVVPTLEKAGVPISGDTVYAGWFLGPKGASQVYTGDPSTKIAEAFPKAVGPNAGMKFHGTPFGEWDFGTLKNWAAAKMGGSAPADGSASIYSGNRAAPQNAGEMLASAVSDPITSWTGWLGQRLGGGLMGSAGSKVPFDAERPYSPSFEPPMQPMGAQFAGQAPVGGVGPNSVPGAGSMALTSRPLPQPDTGWSMDKGTAKDIASLASAGAALMAAGAPRQTWTPGAPAPVHRGQWRDDIFAGLLGL
jgi:hypothetical protein